MSMINGIKEIIRQQHVYQEASSLLVEDVESRGIDDIILGQSTRFFTEAEDPDDGSEGGMEPEFEGDNPETSRGDDGEPADPEENDTPGMEPEPVEPESELGDEAIGEPAPTAAEPPVASGDTDDLGNQSIEDHTPEGGDQPLSVPGVDSLPDTVGAQTGEPAQDDNVVDVNLDLQSNTMRDVLPVPPAGAAQAVASDTMDQHVDAGFGASSGDASSEPIDGSMSPVTPGPGDVPPSPAAEGTDPTTGEDAVVDGDTAEPTTEMMDISDISDLASMTESVTGKLKKAGRAISKTVSGRKSGEGEDSISHAKHASGKVSTIATKFKNDMKNVGEVKTAAQETLEEIIMDEVFSKANGKKVTMLSPEQYTNIVRKFLATPEGKRFNAVLSHTAHKQDDIHQNLIQVVAQTVRKLNESSDNHKGSHTDGSTIKSVPAWKKITGYISNVQSNLKELNGLKSESADLAFVDGVPTGVVITSDALRRVKSIFREAANADTEVNINQVMQRFTESTEWKVLSEVLEESTQQFTESVGDINVTSQYLMETTKSIITALSASFNGDLSYMIGSAIANNGVWNEAAEIITEAITLGGDGGTTSAEDSAVTANDPVGAGDAVVEEVPADAAAEEPAAGGEGENPVTAAVRDKVAEEEGIDGEGTGGGNEELMKKLSSLTKSIEDAKQLVMKKIAT